MLLPQPGIKMCLYTTTIEVSSTALYWYLGVILSSKFLLKVFHSQAYHAFFYLQFFDAAIRANGYYPLHHKSGLVVIRPVLANLLLYNLGPKLLFSHPNNWLLPRHEP